MLKTSWREKAACKGADSTLFHPPTNQDGSYAPDVIEKALAYCNACPVKADCLTFAYENGIRHGVWGGLTVRGRLRYKQQWREERAAS